MSDPDRVCVIGQVLLDVMQGPDSVTRLGGIIHTARTLCAIQSPYCIGYFAPEYLDKDIQRYCKEWGGASAVKVGNTTGSPNLIIVPNPKETSSKQYELIDYEKQRIDYDGTSLRRVLADSNISDIIILPDRFPLRETLVACGETKARVYADINFGPDDLSELEALGRKFETIIISTSGMQFSRRYEGSADVLCRKLFPYCETVLLKENRGGARLFGPRTPNSVITVPAQVRPILHSVGVGDCFNAVFAVERRQFGDRPALNYASSIAAEYASFIHPEEIQQAVASVLSIPPTEMAELSGVSLPWEKRPAINIYIAAPDLDWVDRGPIEEVKEALEYHNFTPRFPVRENGQMRTEDPPELKSQIAWADLTMLDDCKLLLAVLLYDDPGTLIEIGLALERQMPVLVYDPYGRATNLMLTQLPSVVSADLDVIIAGVFTNAWRALNA